MINALMRTLLFIALVPAIISKAGVGYTVTIFALLGFIAGGTVPLILKAVRTIYTPESIGIGASFNTSLAGILTALAQPLIGWAGVS